MNTTNDTRSPIDPAARTAAPLGMVLHVDDIAAASRFYQQLGFTETGAGGLNLIYDEQTFKSFTGNAGLRLTYAWNLAWGVLLPHLRADYVREFEDDVDVFGVRFANDPNAASTPPVLVATDNPDQSYWRLAGGFSAQFRHGISGYIEYQRLESFEFISFEDIAIGLRFQRSF